MPAGGVSCRLLGSLVLKIRTPTLDCCRKTVSLKYRVLRCFVALRQTVFFTTFSFILHPFLDKSLVFFHVFFVLAKRHYLRYFVAPHQTSVFAIFSVTFSSFPDQTIGYSRAFFTTLRTPYFTVLRRCHTFFRKTHSICHDLPFIHSKPSCIFVHSRPLSEPHILRYFVAVTLSSEKHKRFVTIFP